MDQEAAEAAETLIEAAGSDGPDPPCSEAVSRVKKLLFRRMLVGIKDGRFFLGTFHCIDKQDNIILQDSVEYRSTRRNSPSPTRLSTGALAGTRLLRWGSGASTASFSSLALVVFLAMWVALLKNK